jgi:glucose/mannose transport system permease protein
MTRTLENILPKLVIAPGFILGFAFIYGFMIWNGVLSVSASRMLPNYELVGLEQYARLFEMDRWWVALKNLGIFGVLYVGGAMAVGVFLAILLDQKIRAEGALRTIYLYPMALSFIVTGTAWKWMLNPSLGLEKLMHDWGFTSFKFDWLVNTDMAIYCIVIAGIWQSAGFAMALFLAGLRGIDDSIIKAAQVDGASLPRIYWRIILPALRPVFSLRSWCSRIWPSRVSTSWQRSLRAAPATAPTCRPLLCIRCLSRAARLAWARPAPPSCS